MATTATSFPTKLLLAAALALGLSSTACGPITPVTPTWKNDVRPLLISRCMRCHDDPGRVDPAINPATAPPAALYNFNYAELPSPLPAGLMALQSQGPASVKGTIPGVRRMPPPPNEALEDWQIEILETWALFPR